MRAQGGGGSTGRWLALVLLGGVILALAVELTSRLGGPRAPGNLAATATARVERGVGAPEWVLRAPRDPDGSPALAERRLVLAGSGGALELRFRDPTWVAALLIQAAAGDRVRIFGLASDGDWQRLGALRPGAGTVMHTRAIELAAPTELLGLRLVAASEGVVSLGAVRVWEALPEGWPAPQEPSAGAWPLAESPRDLAPLRFALAFAGLLAALAVWQAGRRQGSAAIAKKVLAGLALLSLLAWFDFFQATRALGFQWSVQNHWDVYHYYLGSKYASELGYTELYHCTLAADVEDGLGELRLSAGRVRELRSNVLVPVDLVAADPERCTDRFTPERWQAFRRDVAWFRTRLPPGIWLQISIDHGYNPSPAWNVTGGAIARWIPASELGFALLMAIDVLLLAALWGIAWRTFGLPGVAVALVFFGTNFAAGNTWTHGAFLRHQWFFLSGVALCALRVGRPGAAGFLLAWATLLRIFPGFFVLGVLARIGVDCARERSLRLSPDRWRFVAGGLLGTVVIGAASVLATGDGGAWGTFLENTQKHFAVSALNLMGFLSVVEWAETGVPTGALRIASVLAMAPLTLVALRREPDWAAAILGGVLVPFATELGSYYFVYMCFFGFLAVRRPGVSPALAALAVALAAVGWADADSHARGSFVASSALVLVFLIGVAAAFARRPAPGKAGS